MLTLEERKIAADAAKRWPSGMSDRWTLPEATANWVRAHLESIVGDPWPMSVEWP